MAVLFLPRQFQVAVIENINEDHLNKAIWLFPLYLLVINLFVLPIALAGRLRFPGGEVDADFMILLLPMVEHQHLLTLFTFLGGLSAATAMVIVATVALSTMLCNDLIMPVLLRLRFLRLNEQPDLSGLLLTIRRGSILAMLLLGYAYFRMVGEAYALVTMGLVSFCAAAQFAPPILFGIYWKAATLRGALTGLLAGFLIWLYTLLLPALARSDWIDPSFLDGPFGLDDPQALRPVRGRAGWIRSATRCSGACSPTSPAWSAGRCSAGRAASSASRRRCSSKLTGWAAGRISGGAAPRSPTCGRCWPAMSGRSGPSRRSPGMPGRAAWRSPPAPRRMPIWSTSPSACWPARSARHRPG